MSSIDEEILKLGSAWGKLVGLVIRSGKEIKEHIGSDHVIEYAYAMLYVAKTFLNSLDFEELDKMFGKGAREYYKYLEKNKEFDLLTLDKILERQFKLKTWKEEK
jgi:hypothetical protein